MRIARTSSSVVRWLTKHARRAVVAVDLGGREQDPAVGGDRASEGHVVGVGVGAGGREMAEADGGQLGLDQQLEAGVRLDEACEQLCLG